MQLKYHMITIEDLVPKNHLLRKVEAMPDLSFVYEETAHLYNRKYDRDNDCFLCPNGKELTLTTVSRNAGSSLC